MQEQTSASYSGVFELNDFNEDYKNKTFYFSEYCQLDGEWVEINEKICTIRIGEPQGFMGKYILATIIASKSGIIKHTLEKGESLIDGIVLYKLHSLGQYENENSPLNFEYKEFFKSEKDGNKLEKWFVNDGDYLRKGDRVFQYKNNENERLENYSKKTGFIEIVNIKFYSLLNGNSIIYFIRDNDELRVNKRFQNIPNIVLDEFTGSTIINWKSVSSSNRSIGVNTLSDTGATNLIFSFNYIDNNDYITFQFDPKQIRPNQFDTIKFLFENEEKIQFELFSNPISTRSIDNNKILESKVLITKSELQLFATVSLKKWKISLLKDNIEILGGENGGNIYYKSKNNLQIVIRKFAREYIDLVNESVPLYSPIELRQVQQIQENPVDHCYVYLMKDISNDYFKIGISNKPNYREKTLQSEKPTIELIIAKRFPIRKIAESIEKALHTAYAEKRLRGEWFDLSINDIEHIKATLK